MLFSDLMQMFGSVAPPLGGPAMQLLAKAQSNATGGNVPGVKPPPLSSPGEMMNSATAANSANYENRLRELQGQQIAQQVGFGKQLSDQLPALMAMLYSGQGQGAGQDQPQQPAQQSPFGSLSPSPPPKLASGGGTDAPGRMSLSELRAAAERAGFQGDPANIIAATAMAESGGNPHAANEKGEHSYGVTQINADAHGPVAREALGNPDRAMELAYKISKGGTDFTPWTMFKNGGYKQYLGAAPAPMSLSGGGGQEPAAVQLAQNGPLASLPAAPPSPASPNAPASSFGSLSPGGAMQAPSANPAMTPLQRAIVQFGVLSRMAKMGDVAQPMEQAFYNSPEFKGRVAGAENRAKYLGPEADPALQGMIAGNRKQAEVGPTQQIATHQSALDTARERTLVDLRAGQEPHTFTMQMPDGTYKEVQTTKKAYSDLIAGQQQPRSAGAAPAVSEQQQIQAAPGNGAPVPGVVGKPYFTPEQIKEQEARSAFQQTVGDLNGKDFMTRRTGALDAGKSLDSATEARKLLDSGVLTGSLAPFEVSLGKALQAAGYHYKDDAIANTEAFGAARAMEVGRLIKQFGSGTGLSDADRQYAAKMAGGEIKLNEESIRRILDIGDRATRKVITDFNTDASKINPAFSPYPLSVTMPPVYAAPQKGAGPARSGVTPSGLQWSVVE